MEGSYRHGQPEEETGKVGSRGLTGWHLSVVDVQSIIAHQESSPRPLGSKVFFKGSITYCLHSWLRFTGPIWRFGLELLSPASPKVEINTVPTIAPIMYHNVRLSSGQSPRQTKTLQSGGTLRLREHLPAAENNGQSSIRILGSQTVNPCFYFILLFITKRFCIDF